MVAGCGHGGQRTGGIQGGPSSDPGATLARLCRFYPGIGPEGFLTMPLYQLAILTEHLPALEASEMRAAMTAASAPHMKDGNRRTLYRQLDSLARPLEPREEPQPIEKIAHDPEAAAAWFADMGVKVVSSG